MEHPIKRGEWRAVEQDVSYTPSMTFLYESWLRMKLEMISICEINGLNGG